LVLALNCFQQCVSFFGKSGAWLPPEALDSLRAGSTVSFPWFQSATTDEVHSYTLLGLKDVQFLRGTK
jgi:hypothetical protein